MTAKMISEMTSDEIFEAVDRGMKNVATLLETGQINRSGRYYSDAELAAGASELGAPHQKASAA